MKNTSVNTKTKGVGLMRSGKELDIVTIMGAEVIAYSWIAPRRTRLTVGRLNRS